MAQGTTEVSTERASQLQASRTLGRGYCADRQPLGPGHPSRSIMLVLDRKLIDDWLNLLGSPASSSHMSSQLREIPSRCESSEASS
jgi:hypothetical protein